MNKEHPCINNCALGYRFGSVTNKGIVFDSRYFEKRNIDQRINLMSVFMVVAQLNELPLPAGRSLRWTPKIAYESFWRSRRSSSFG